MRLDEKKLREAESRVRQYLREGKVRTTGKAEYVGFFTTNAENSLNAALALYALSTDKSKQRSMGFTHFDGLLWVVNASYYSMFYMARALLEGEGIKLETDQSLHALTFDALISFFYLTEKLQKRLIESFAEAQEEAAELLGKQAADDLIEAYFFERRKRGAFTYDMGAVVLRAKAETSLERAKRFTAELRKILGT